MRAVWKFTITPDTSRTIAMPAGSTVLAVQTLNGTPSLWALVDPSAPLEDRHFLLVATGEQFDAEAKNAQYIATFQIVEAHTLVFHLFERFPQ